MANGLNRRGTPSYRDEPQTLATLFQYYANDAITDLKQSPLRTILKRAQAIQSVSDLVYTILPEKLRTGYLNAVLTKGRLCILVSNPHVARSLRYEQTLLKNTLAQAGLEITQLSFRVQLQS